MNHMDHIPNEIVVNILGFVKDRIYVSMVSHRMMSLLNLMYEQSMINDIDDPYYLKKEYNAFNIINISKKIYEIKNCNCLNYIYKIVSPTIHNISDNSDKIKSSEKWKLFGDNRQIPFLLLKSYFYNGNIANEKRMCILIKYSLQYTDAFEMNMPIYSLVIILINKKNINILKYLGYKINIAYEFLTYYNNYDKPRPLNPKIITKEFLYLIDHNITTLNYVYRNIQSSTIPIKNDIIQLLNKKIDPMMLELLTI